jgi:hypothetical protein
MPVRRGRTRNDSMPLIDSFTHLSIMVNAIMNRSPNG